MILPDGTVSVVGLAAGTGTLDPSLDSSFLLMSDNPATRIQGIFADPDFLSGTYALDTSGTFGAARIGSTSDARYRFTGTFNVCNQDYGDATSTFRDSRFSAWTAPIMSPARHTVSTLGKRAAGACGPRR